MSTKRRYALRSNDAAAQIAQSEVARRRLELARLRTLQSLAERNRQAVLASARVAQNTLVASVREAQTLGATESGLAHLRDAAEAVGSRLTEQSSALERAQVRLSEAQSELAEQLRQACELSAESTKIETRLEETVREAQQLRDRLRRSSEAVDSAGEELTAASRETECLVAAETELTRRLEQAEAEIAFLTNRADTIPAAALTLLAMEENGYQLRGTVDQAGLVSYFQQSDAEHVLAVRLAPLPQESNLARYELVAETFGLQGETCLDEIADFETAMEACSTASLQTDPSASVYPKKPGARSTLPEPRRDRLSRRVQRKRAVLPQRG